MKNVVLSVVLLVVLLFTCTVPLAQQPSHNHQLATISGKDHPELIPDVTAYSLVLSVLSAPANATDQDRAGRIAHVKKIGLDVHDTLQLIAITDAFRTQYDSMLKTHNESIIPVVGPASQPDNTQFEQKRQAFVLDTIEQIKRELTPDGVKQFLDHVQAEKANMTISGGAQ
jgi:hypothetical protein